MATLNGEWSLKTTNTGTTASYKIGTKEVVKLTNLNSNVKVDETDKSLLTGVTVTEDDSAGNKITLSESALGTANIAFTSSTYKLELDDAIPQTVEIKNPELTVASGKATVKGTLTKAYTLSANGKTVTYSPQKDNQELATVTGLDTTKASAANVELGDDTITLKADALKQGKASLTLKNGAAYTLALDDVAPPTSTVTAVDYKSGTATIKGTVDTAGYYVAPDGKSVNYVKKTTSAGTLATVKGLNAELDKSAISTEQDADGSYNINITSGLLVDQKDVTISSTNGYRLKLDSAVSKPSAQNEWAVKGTVATYKQVQPAYYDDLGTKIAYVKEADVQTYATVKGLANNLTAEGTSLKDSNGAVATLSGKTITLKSGALTTTNVTLDGDGYSLKLDPSDTNITPLKVDTSTAPTWSVSKTTATYKGKTTAGWGQKDAQTIAYSKAAGSTVLATVDNLVSGLKPADLNDSAKAETYIAVNNSTGVITLPSGVLNGQSVTVTPGDGFKYTPALGTGVEQEAKEAHTWEEPAEGTTTAKLYKGTTDYYTVSGQTAVYHAADKGSKVATIQNLAEGLTAEDLNNHTEVNFANKVYTVTLLSEELFGGKTITITGTGYNLNVPECYAVQKGLTTWEKDNDTTATFYEYNSEGYAPDAKGTQIVYTPARKGATLGTVTGLKKGFVVAEDGTIDGLAGYATETVVSEETVVDGVTIPAKVIPAKTIVITKPVVGNDPIVLTSSYGYSLAVGEGLTDSTTPTQSWDVKSNAAVYTLTTPAGYSLSEENTVFTPTKASKITVTLTGLGTTNVEEIEDGIDVKDAEKVMTLKADVLGKNNVTAKGDYTLALDEDVDAPGFGTMTWNMTKKGTAVLKADVTTAGYTAGGKTIAYTEQEDAKELATVSGLTNVANADATEVKNDGKAGLKASTDGTITVGQAVLGTSKVSVKGDGYSLALGSDVPTGYATAENEWILKGTTATLQSYKKGFYSLDKTGAIAFTKDTKATVHATISGLAKITDANKETVAASISLEGDTITLGADALGTSTVKLKNGKDSEGVATSYKLALGGDVPTETKKVTEWVSNGTKITYQNYDKGFYTLSGSDITFTKDKNVKALLTVSGNGLVSGATVAQFDEDNKFIYLGAEQLADTKNKSTVTLKTSAGYEDYKLKLVDSGSNAVEIPDPETSTDWKTAETTAKTTTATYSQIVDDGQFVCDGTTITYYQESAEIKLATLTGLNNDIGYNFENVTVENGVITLTEDILQTSDFASAKIAVKEKGYTLAIDDSVATPKHGTPKWDLTTVKTKGTATYNDTVTEGYTVNEKDKRSITYSAEKTTNTLTTLSGLNKNYTVNTEATPAAQATAAGLSVDAETGVITLSNRDLLTTSKVTLKNASGQDYTLAVNESLAPTDLKPETAVWTLKGTKASLNLGKSAGYELDTKSKTATTVNYVKQDASTVIATLEGLDKNVKLQDGKLGTLTKVGKTQEFTEGVFMRAGNEIALTQDVLGTTDVKLTNTDGYSYTIADENFTKSTTGDLIWSNDPTKGTATLSQTTTEGWELQNDNTLLKYTANKVNATIATLSGLNKEFKGDIDEAVSVDGNTITVEKAALLGTSKVTIKNADKNNEYVLALTEDKEEIPQDGDERTGWLTSGTKATYKTYKQAYYSIDKGAIVYNKAVDVKNSTVAEVSGIKKDEDISDCVDGNIITLGAGQLENKNVTLKNTKDLGNYTLALGSDAEKATLADTAKWTTKSGTASLVGSVSTGYTASSDGLKLTYSNKETTPAIAIIKGLETDLTGEVSTADTTITLSKSQLKPKVTVDGKETFDFDFDADYSGTITGSATADTITAGGDNVSIGTAKGNDVITASGASVSILAGDGKDTIDVTGSAAFVNAGKGDDSIKSSGQANIFFYANGDGNDVIANFAPAKDKIKTNGTLVSVKQEGSDAVITIGKTNALGTITLTGKGTSADSIIIIDNKDNEIAHPSASSDVLLADDNYSMNAAALTDITEPFKASYTPYDFESNLDLVKKDSFASAVTYASDDK